MTPNVLDLAADRLRGRWHQGAGTGPDESVCLLRAFYVAAERFRDATALVNARRALSAELGGVGVCAVIRFNDDPSTTEEDVLLLLKRASVRLDAAAEEAR